MEWIQTLILGMVEGLTEFLPISSTAHLLIAGDILKISQTEFFKTFVIAVQLGAILAVVFMYWRKILGNINIAKKVLMAFIPTAIIGFLLYKIIKNFLFENFTTIAWALIVGGIIILIFEFLENKKRETESEINLENISYKKSFIIGLIQALAVIPGVSRSGATIIGGMALGVSRKSIVEFSFLLAIPTIFAATGYDIISSPIELSSQNTTTLLLGSFFSFVFAWLSIKFLIKFIQKNSFKIFGYYRIVLGACILLFL